jgi:hypothetical protein
MNATGRGRGWSFPEGTVGHNESVKGYRVAARDGEDVGEVSWADYRPGESYLVLTRHEHLRTAHHVVPAGAVASVDHGRRTVTLAVTAAEVRASPEHEDPERPIDWELIDRFERGLAAGAAVWPYADV